MKMKTSTLAFAILCSVALLSCQKKDEETKYKSMTGKITFNLPEFVHKGDKLTFPHSKVVLEDGSWTNVGYYWAVSKFALRDTTKRVGDPTPASELEDWSFTVPDRLCTFTVTGVAFSSGYYDKTTSLTSTVIDTCMTSGKGSITGFKEYDTDVKVKDSRDGKEYLATPVGDLLWMRQNLVWRGAGQAYRGYKELSAIFGQFYSWEEAHTACDLTGDGKWRLPTDEEWAELARAAGDSEATSGKDFATAAGGMMSDAYFNGDKLWEFWPSVKITDKTHLSAMPFGYAVNAETGYNFSKLYAYAFFWTADTEGDKAVARYLYSEDSIVHRGIFDKTYTIAPVRCVRKKDN